MSRIILQATIDDVVNKGLSKLLYCPVDDITDNYVSIERKAAECFIVTFKSGNKIFVEVFDQLEISLDYIKEYIRAIRGIYGDLFLMPEAT